MCLFIFYFVEPMVRVEKHYVKRIAIESLPSFLDVLCHGNHAAVQNPRGELQFLGENRAQST